MKKLVLVSLLFFFLGIWHQLSIAQQGLHPLEIRRDLLMERRYAGTLEALREKNNAKTITMLRTVRKEFVSGMEKLKPEYERWINTLSVMEIEQLMERLNDKKYFELIVELQTDKAVIDRYLTNQDIFREYRILEITCDRAITF